MAIIQFFSFSALGTNFSPQQAEVELRIKFQSQFEKGEKEARTGRIYNVGYGAFNSYRDLNALLDIVETNITDFRRLGADEFSFGLNVIHDGQCNFDIPPDLLMRIARLGFGLEISTYEETEKTFEKIKSSAPSGP